MHFCKAVVMTTCYVALDCAVTACISDLFACQSRVLVCCYSGSKEARALTLLPLQCWWMFVQGQKGVTGIKLLIIMSYFSLIVDSECNKTGSWGCKHEHSGQNWKLILSTVGPSATKRRPSAAFLFTSIILLNGHWSQNVHQYQTKYLCTVTTAV